MNVKNKTQIGYKESCTQKPNYLQEPNFKERVNTLTKTKKNSKPKFVETESLISDLFKNIDEDQRHLNLLQEHINLQSKAKSLLKKRSSNILHKGRFKTKTLQKVKFNHKENILNSSLDGNKHNDSEINNYFIINNNYINKQSYSNIKDYSSPRKRRIPQSKLNRSDDRSPSSQFNDNNDKNFKESYLKVLNECSFTIVQIGNRNDCSYCRNRGENSYIIEKPIKINIEKSCDKNNSDQTRFISDKQMKMSNETKIINNKLNSEQSTEEKSNLELKNMLNNECEKTITNSQIITSDFKKNESYQIFIGNKKGIMANESEISLNKLKDEKSSRHSETMTLKNNFELDLSNEIIKSDIFQNRKKMDLLDDDIATKNSFNVFDMGRIQHEQNQGYEINKISLNSNIQTNFNGEMEELNKVLDHLLNKIELYTLRKTVNNKNN
jgi:hypothetical protein